MENIKGWQIISLCWLALWIVISSIFNVTQKLRSFTQSWVINRVLSDIPTIIKIQKYQHPRLDTFFSGLSCVVSVPFYTAFLPLLFWTGHCKLARQMTLLMAFCDYIGNCIKDVVSAPRPRCPPVRRITATKDEEEHAMEYGLPSSHTLNTLCLSGYLSNYVMAYIESDDYSMKVLVFMVACSFVVLVGLGRVYLGMHSPIDIICGLVLGLGILATWLSISEHIDSFVVSGQNVVSYWTALSVLLLFAYPTPECPTPSFEFHTAFTGVALGIVIGIQQTFNHFHHENVARVFSHQLTFPAFVGRLMLGIPTILFVKFCSKALAKWILPVLAYTLGIPITSTAYVPTLNVMASDKKSVQIKQLGYLQNFFFFSKHTSFDIDTGIRFLQYTGLSWSVVDLVPSMFARLGL